MTILITKEINLWSKLMAIKHLLAHIICRRKFLACNIDQAMDCHSRLSYDAKRVLTKSRGLTVIGCYRDKTLPNPTASFVTNTRGAVVSLLLPTSSEHRPCPTILLLNPGFNLSVVPRSPPFQRLPCRRHTRPHHDPSRTRLKTATIQPTQPSLL